MNRVKLLGGAAALAALAGLGLLWRDEGREPAAARQSASAPQAVSPAPAQAPEAARANVPTLEAAAPPVSAGIALADTLRAGVSRVLMRDAMTPHQVAVRDLRCEGQACRLDLQLPPFVEASIRHDNKVASDLFAALKEEYAKQGARVALAGVEHGREGMAMSFELSTGPEPGRYLTDTQIAEIRAETLRDHLKAQADAKAQR